MNRWVLGARPRTLPAAIVPVALGVGCAAGARADLVVAGGAGACRQLRLAGRRQLRQRLLRRRPRHRRGPGRPGTPRRFRAGDAGGGQAGGAVVFAVAAVAGLVLAATTSWWLLAVGVPSIAAAWGYTGGPRPYGYLGLGELFVFVFFGLVATVGTTYVSVERITGLSVVIGCAAGFVACALLVVNNLRDIPTDRAAGKRTLAVRLGDRRTRWLYLALIAATFVAVVVAAVSWRPPALIGLAAAVLAVPPVRRVRGATGPALIAVLGETSRLQLAFGALTTLGLALGA